MRRNNDKMLLESLVRKYGKNNIIKAINESHKQRITIKFIDDLINREINTAESDDWESIIEAWDDEDYEVIDNFCEYILDTIAEETDIPDWEIREKYEKQIYNQVYKQIKKRLGNKSRDDFNIEEFKNWFNDYMDECVYYEEAFDDEKAFLDMCSHDPNKVIYNYEHTTNNMHLSDAARRMIKRWIKENC